MIIKIPSPTDRYDRANEAAFRRTLEQGLSQMITEVNANGSFYTKVQSDARFSLLGHTHAFADLTAKPTTVAGYGITDFNSLGDARWSLLGHTHAFADLTAKPTTIAGYGITDFNALGDARWSLLAHTHTFASITSKPTTIAGYGITDFNSLGDARWSLLGHTHTFASITAKPTTIAGYGITDFNSLGDARWGQTAVANTWSGANTFAASTATRATVNVAVGVAPTAPNNGDIWMTSVGLFVRNNGVTEQLTGSMLLE